MKIGNMDGILDLRNLLEHRAEYEHRELGDLGPDGPLRWLVVHHTGGAERDFSAQEINDYHLNVLGWDGGIGYHFLVHLGGKIDYVGDILTIRWNTARQNDKVIGICLAGDFTRKPPLSAQIKAAHDLVANLQLALGWFVPVAGHREIALPGYGTSCPGNTWSQWKDKVVMEAP